MNGHVTQPLTGTRSLLGFPGREPPSIHPSSRGCNGECIAIPPQSPPPDVPITRLARFTHPSSRVIRPAETAAPRMSLCARRAAPRRKCVGLAAAAAAAAAAAFVAAGWNSAASATRRQYGSIRRNKGTFISLRASIESHYARGLGQEEEGESEREIDSGRDRRVGSRRALFYVIIFPIKLNHSFPRRNCLPSCGRRNTNSANAIRPDSRDQCAITRVI
jgi:hypothetical protein